MISSLFSLPITVAGSSFTFAMKKFAVSFAAIILCFSSALSAERSSVAFRDTDEYDPNFKTDVIRDGMVFTIRPEHGVAELKSVKDVPDDRKVNLIIPDTVQYVYCNHNFTLWVDRFVDGCFKGESKIKSIVFPVALTRLSVGMLDGTSITTLRIPSSILDLDLRVLQSRDSVIVEEGDYALNCYHPMHPDTPGGPPARIPMPKLKYAYIGRSLFQSFPENKEYYGQVEFFNAFKIFAESPIERVVCSDNVKYLWEGIFGDCKSLKSAKLGCTTVPKRCFDGTENIREITLTEGVEQIEDRAFYDTRPVIFQVMSSTPPAVVGSSFTWAYSTYTTTPLTVPIGSEDAYASEFPWSKFTTIGGADFSEVEILKQDEPNDNGYEYFNLNGMRVGCENALPAGIYLRRHRDKTEKIVVR